MGHERQPGQLSLHVLEAWPFQEADHAMTASRGERVADDTLLAPFREDTLFLVEIAAEFAGSLT
ncbi:MAG TPA: hypothetical protein VIK57_02575 [Streptosporangiaceae bacterium]